MERTVISTENAPAAVGPYSQAIVANGFIFCAGQIPLVPGSNELVEPDITLQTRRVLDNLKAVLEAAGSSLDRVVKTTVFLADINDTAAMNAVYAEYFPVAPPARSTIQVARLPRSADVRIEIELIALA